MSSADDLNLLRVLQKKGLLESIPHPLPKTGKGRGIIRALVDAELVEESAAIQALREELGVRFIDVTSPDVQRKFAIDRLIEFVSADFCWESNVLPLWEEDERVIVGCVNPLDYQSKRFLEFRFEKPIEFVVCIDQALHEVAVKHLAKYTDDLDELREDRASVVEVATVSTKEDQNIESVKPDDPPIVKLVNKMLAEAVRMGASDLHLEPEQTGLSVRFRIDGILHQIMKIPQNYQLTVTSRIKLISGMDISERRRPQDGRFRVAMGTKKIDIRASSLPITGGEKIVLRLLRSGEEEAQIENLHFPDPVKLALQRVMALRSKIFLVTGPTGSGKTTTLYAALNSIKDGTRSITSVEDPVEIKIPGINQVQVNIPAGVTFASALRSILRQDPDVIMVGEIRDPETADVAMQAAQTGHLVLSTLHTNSAPAVITRLMNLDCKPHIIATSLAGVLSQRLVRRICPRCKDEINQAERSSFQELIDMFELHNSKLLVGRGCQNCNNTGYTGRAVIASFLHVNDKLSDLIAKSASLDEIVACARKGGYKPLEDAAIELVQNGITSLEEVKGYLLSSVPSRESVHISGDDTMVVSTTSKRKSLHDITRKTMDITPFLETVRASVEKHKGPTKEDLCMAVARDYEDNGASRPRAKILPSRKTTMILDAIYESETKTISTISEGEISIGREMDNSVIIESAAVSRNHAVISPAGSYWVFKDLGSTNGSFINDVQVFSGQYRVLRNNDHIRIANFEMKVGFKEPREQHASLVVFQVDEFKGEYSIDAEACFEAGGPRASIVLAGEDLSQVQFYIVAKDGNFYIGINKLKGKVIINGVVGKGVVSLTDGDQITVGQFKILVNIPSH